MAKSSLTVVIGADDFLVERAIDEVVANARKVDPEVERRTVDAAAVGAIGELDQACSPTLFGGSAVVVVTGVEGATPEFVAATVGHAQIGDVAIVVSHPGGVKGKKQLASLEAAAADVHRCPEIKKGRSLAEFAVGEFRRHNRRIDESALNLLLAAVGSDPRAVAAACAQLASDIESGEIDIDDVADYFGGTIEVTGFQIADEVMRRNASEALRLMRLAESADGAARLGPATVSSLVNAVRQLVAVATAPPGLTERDIAARAKVPPWKVRQLSGQVRRWGQRDLAAAIVMLADLDAATKGGLREGEQLEPVQKGLLLEKAVANLATAKS